MSMDFKYIQTKSLHDWLNSKEFIILHHTGGKKSWDIKVLTEKRYDSEWKDISVSCHYYFPQDGDNYQFAKDDQIARHAGISEWWDKTDLNRYSLWIEIESFDWNTYTDIQRKNVLTLCVDLCEKYNISPYNILRHAEISPWRKVDVWLRFFDPFGGIEWFRSAVITKIKWADYNKDELVYDVMDDNSKLYNELTENQIMMSDLKFQSSHQETVNLLQETIEKAEAVKYNLNKVNNYFRSVWFDDDWK